MKKKEMIIELKKLRDLHEKRAVELDDRLCDFQDTEELTKELQREEERILADFWDVTERADIYRSAVDFLESEYES